MSAFPAEKIIKGKQYFSLELYLNNENRISVGAQTHWVGWADTEMKTELRAASLVRPDWMTKFWIDFGMPFSIVNTIGDFARWYLSGGHALVEKDIATKLLPEAIHPTPCVQTGSQGFTSVARLPNTLFRPAPTPKLRMVILKRDDYRCRICGRRPEKHVDIELHVHHIRPTKNGGPTHEDNLITLCSTCHRGLEPHYDWSLYGLLEERPENVKEHERRKYLLGVEAYRKSIQASFSEPVSAQH